MTKTPLHHLIFGFIFFLLVALDIYLGSTSHSFFRIVSKPFILISLIVYFFLNRKGMQKRSSQFTLMALVFSLVGDVFLLFDSVSELYFILGLSSFLLAHIFYAFCFYTQRSSKNGLDLWITTLLFTGYGFALYSILYSYLGNIKIPVSIYILAILIMILMAYKRKGNVSGNSFILVFFGALSFIISDSFLAINKFITPLPYSNLMVMGTYAIAQYLIIRGLIRDTHGDTH
ncbi:MAG: putative membrane protein YhhN [Sediminicola sp.]